MAANNVTVSGVYTSVSDCPIIDYPGDTRVCYFSTERQNHWNRDAQVSVSPAVPVVLSASAGHAELQLQFTVTNPSAAGFGPGTYSWSAQIADRPVALPYEFQISAADSANKEFLLSQPLTAPIVGGTPKSLPWSFLAKGPTPLRIRLQRKNDVNIIKEVQLEVEIYVLQPSLPSYFIKSGLPLSLLRLETLIPAWTVSNSADWGEFVILALFQDKRLTYQNWGGSAKYVTINPDRMDPQQMQTHGVHTTCWLELFLSDLNGITQRGDVSTTYAVNCYDLAAVAQVILSLGLAPQTLRMKYMQPYGYINTTRLIGKPGDVNNPYAGKPGIKPPAPWLAQALDPGRLPFGNHTFLTRDLNDARARDGPVVLDACCGPQTGLCTLIDYPTTAIDQSIGLYGVPNRPVRPGRLPDIRDGPGVVGVTSICPLLSPEKASLAGPLNAQPQLFRDMSGDLARLGTLRNPVLSQRNYTLESHGMTCATWTFAPGAAPPLGPDTVTINIFLYSVSDINDLAVRGKDVEDEWLRRTQAIPGFAKFGPEPQKDGASVDVDGCIRMTWSPDKLFIVQIEDTAKNLALLNSLADAIKIVLAKQALPQIRTALNIASDFVVPPPTRVNQTLSVQISAQAIPAGADTNSWRAYRVETLNGNLLATNVAVDPATRRATFNFLGRRPGSENVFITLFDGNLKQREAAFSTLVLPP